MNEIFISGRLTRDPEVKASAQGREFTTFTIASNRYAGKEKGEQADFFNCICSGEKGIAVSKYFKKGDQIIVIGEMASQKGKKENNQDTTYWNVNVSKFEFGAKKGTSEQGQSSEGVIEGFEKINAEDIPF